MKEKLSLKTRLQAPTPKFFKRIYKLGILLGAVGTAVISAPVTLPAIVCTTAGYLITAGLVASAVSSVTVKREGE